MAVGDAHVFPGFLTPVQTQLFFPKPKTTFLTCFYRDERQKYAVKKVCLNQGSNSQPPGPESDTLTTEPLVRGLVYSGKSLFICQIRSFIIIAILTTACYLSRVYQAYNSYVLLPFIK